MIGITEALIILFLLILCEIVVSISSMDKDLEGY